MSDSASCEGGEKSHLFLTHKWRKNPGGRDPDAQTTVVPETGCCVCAAICGTCTGKGRGYSGSIVGFSSKENVLHD